MDADPAPAAPAALPDRPAGWPALDALLAATVVALAAFLASFAAANSDLWVHLAAGRLVAHGQFPFGIDPFSALDPPPPWVNHAWLFDLLLYGLYQSAGGPALVAVKAGLVAVLAAVLLLIRRSGAGSLLPAVATTLALLALSPRLLLQPIIVSYLLFAVLLLLLHRVPRRVARWQVLAAVGVLFALWVNVDGGFVYGLGLLALWLVGALLQAAIPLGTPGADAAEEPHSPATLAGMLAVAAAASLVNPYLYRAFGVPAELVPLTLPEALRRDQLLEVFSLSAYSPAYVERYAGPLPAAAYYALLLFGVGSFALNVAGWRWTRALAWLAFAWLVSYSWRVVPYFAIVAGPVLVLNVQAFLARRRVARAATLTPGLAHLLTVLAGAGRVAALLAGLALLAAAWPGWLAPSAVPGQQPRRVAWRLDPDPTLERQAKRLGDWYKAGALRPGEDLGFFLQPELNYYCAWFSPQAKGVFDLRLTAPVAVAEDYARLHRELLDYGRYRYESLATGRAARPGEAPEPPDKLARKLGVTYLAAAGRPMLERGLARVLLGEPGHWPPWVFDGRGMLCGWRDPARPGPDSHTNLRLDAVARAVGPEATAVPSPTTFATPTVPTVWDRYRASAAPVPPEAYEAALWLIYRDAVAAQSGQAFNFVRLASGVGRGAVPALLDIPGLIDPRQINAILEPSWLRSPDGRAARVAPLLAVRAARRAILANPADYESYLRLAAAYGALDTDPSLGRLQQITAARQALARLSVAAAYGQSTAFDEAALQEMLFGQYRAMLQDPEAQFRPLDLALEAFERLVELFPRVAPLQAGAQTREQAEAMGKALDEEFKQRQKLMEQMRQDVQKRRDSYETAAGKYPPPARAAIALQYGLPREALSVLRNADPAEMTAQSVELLLHLLLLAGEAEAAHNLLQEEALNPLTRLPFDDQMRIRTVQVQTAAALGDYTAGIDALADSLRAFPRLAGPALSGALQALVVPDVSPMHPLARVATAPSWAGVWPREGQPWPGDLLAVAGVLQQNAEEQVRQAMLALEQGDPALAKRRFVQALNPVGPRVNFRSRILAMRWLGLFEK
jgi:hypothetical protein